MIERFVIPLPEGVLFYIVGRLSDILGGINILQVALQGSEAALGSRTRDLCFPGQE